MHRRTDNLLSARVALAIAAHMRFEPAMLLDKPVGVWVAQPISFSVGS